MPLTKRRDLEERFALLEDRVFKIELRLGPEATGLHVQPEPKNFVTEESAETAAAQLAATESASDQWIAAPSVAVQFADVQLAGVKPIERRPERANPLDRTPLSIAYATPASAPEPEIRGALERTIGLKWAGWIGAVVLVIGAAFGVKFVYDQHWFAEVPAALWLSAIFIAGLALIGVGEAIYRRVHIIPAASVFGAGVATLFLAGYVGHAYYDLYNPGTALFLMGAAALVGALVAMRGNLVSIAVLSLVGANLAPLLVGSRSAPLESFLVYLLALQMVALTLASWGRGRKWWTLRGLSLASTALWVAGAGFEPGEESLVLFFSVVYALLYQGELLFSAMRTRDTEGSAVVVSDGTTYCLLVTAFLTSVVLWSTRLLPDEARGMVILAMAALSAAIGFGIRFSLAEKPTSVVRIGLAHRVAAIGLLALAIPVAFKGVSADVAWGVLAIAFIVTAFKTGSRIARVAGIATWILAVAHLAVGTFLPPELGGHRATAMFSLFGTEITRDAIVAFTLSLFGQFIAGPLVPQQGDEPVMGKSLASPRRPLLLLSATATAVWVVASVLALPPLAATAWIVEYAWLLVAAEALVPSLQFSVQAAVLIVFAALKWTVVDTLADRLSPEWSALVYRAVLNPQMGIALLLCASVVTLYAIRRHAIWRALGAGKTGGLPEKSARLAIELMVAIILSWAVTLEIDRLVEQMQAMGSLRWPLWQAKLLAWTLMWTIAIAGAFAIKRWRDPVAAPGDIWPRVLPIGLMLLAVKFLTLDTLVWRLMDAPANVALVANLETLTGAVVLASLVMLFVIRLPSTFASDELKLRRTVGVLGAMVLLWCGSIEIDRSFSAATALGAAVVTGARPEQMSFSIFWSLFAVACVLLGFRVRAVELRYFGLGLFAVTLLKVVLIDMSQVQAGYRILSFMGLGALMLGTSVLYGKLGPRLLREEADEESQMSIG